MIISRLRNSSIRASIAFVSTRLDLSTSASAAIHTYMYWDKVYLCPLGLSSAQLIDMAVLWCWNWLLSTLGLAAAAAAANSEPRMRSFVIWIHWGHLNVHKRKTCFLDLKDHLTSTIQRGSVCVYVCVHVHWIEEALDNGWSCFKSLVGWKGFSTLPLDRVPKKENFCPKSVLRGLQLFPFQLGCKKTLMVS